MENSYKYFENKECKYYPCHKGKQNINCMFCYCPFYEHEKCPGNAGYIETEGKTIWLPGDSKLMATKVGGLPLWLSW